jgi:hypothetical protein
MYIISQDYTSRDWKAGEKRSYKTKKALIEAMFEIGLDIDSAKTWTKDDFLNELFNGGYTVHEFTK